MSTPNSTTLVPQGPFLPDLAWTPAGTRYAVPDHAVGWRVYQRASHHHRCKPIQMFGPNGPLHLPIDSSFSALRAAVKNAAGYYELVAVDENMVDVPSLPHAVVEIVLQDETETSPPDQTAVICELSRVIREQAAYMAQEKQVMADALKNVIEYSLGGFGEVQTGTAKLLEAAVKASDIASGASLPTQPQTTAPGTSFLDFMISPTGQTVVKTMLSNVKDRK